MLDDLKQIHERDVQDALGIAERQWKQLEHDFAVEGENTFHGIENIVYAGMGGSALAALMSLDWPGYHVPFEICRNYTLPGYVNNKTLVIAASYSGNTEETRSAIQQAKEKGAQIAVIAGGGALMELAEQEGYVRVRLPKAEQPRYAVLFNLKALVTVLEQAGFVREQDATRTLHETAAFLQSVVGRWSAVVPTAQNPAKQLALELMGRSPVIYAGPLMSPAAYKWKISFNENAKNIAWWGTIPEFNHNEFIGWSSHPIDKPYAVVELHSSFEHPRVQKRFEVGERLLSGMRPVAHVVDAEGETLLQQLLFCSIFGDFVTLYVALLNGVNPTPVELVERFKKELG